MRFALACAALALAGASAYLFLGSEPPPPRDPPSEAAEEATVIYQMFLDEGTELAAKEPSTEDLARCAFPILELPFRVVGTIAGSNPEAGVASIGDPNGENVRTLKPGETLGEGVALVAVLRTKVVVRREKKLGCLLAHWFSAAPSDSAMPTPSSTPAVNEPGLEVEGTKTKVTRTYFDHLTGPRLAETLAGCLVTPVIEDGQVTGYRISRIKDGSIYQKIGLVDGDLILSINAVPLGDAAQVIALLKGLKQESTFSIMIDRNGTREMRSISVQ